VPYFIAVVNKDEGSAFGVQFPDVPGAPEVPAQVPLPVTFNDRFQNAAPSVGADRRIARRENRNLIPNRLLNSIAR
jgi:hypothetical protein